MTFRAAPLVLLACALGCAGQQQAGPRHMDISRQVVRSYRATYATACARYNQNRARDLDAAIAQQQALLQESVEERRQLNLEAAHLRAFSRAPDEIRLVQAMNLEGEARKLRGDIRNRRQVIGTLDDRASWHRRQAAAERRRIALILRNPVSLEGYGTDSFRGWAVDAR